MLPPAWLAGIGRSPARSSVSSRPRHVADLRSPPAPLAPLTPRALAAQGSDGGYKRTREGVEFSQYMRDNGYHIIPIKPQHQLEYGESGAPARLLLARPPACPAPVLWAAPHRVGCAMHAAPTPAPSPSRPARQAATA